MEGGGNGMERETGGIAIKGFDPPNPVDKQSSFPFWLYGNGPIFFSNHPATNLEIADGGAILDEMSWLTAFLTDVSRGRGRARGALDGGILTILEEKEQAKENVRKEALNSYNPGRKGVRKEKCKIERKEDRLN
jgi:hypothetical protein